MDAFQLQEDDLSFSGCRRLFWQVMSCCLFSSSHTQHVNICSREISGHIVNTGPQKLMSAPSNYFQSDCSHTSSWAAHGRAWLNQTHFTFMTNHSNPGRGKKVQPRSYHEQALGATRRIKLSFVVSHLRQIGATESWQKDKIRKCARADSVLSSLFFNHCSHISGCTAQTTLGENSFRRKWLITAFVWPKIGSF